MKTTAEQLESKAGTEAVIAECKGRHVFKNGVVFVTSASAAKLELVKDTKWDGTVRGFRVKNPAFSMAIGEIDGNPVMICEDNRLGVHYSIVEDMLQLFEGSTS